MASGVKRQAAFLKSVLREADDHKRKEQFRMANGDQINAVSELALNVMKGVVPVSNQAKIRLTLRQHTLPIESTKSRHKSQTTTVDETERRCGLQRAFQLRSMLRITWVNH